MDARRAARSPRSLSLLAGIIVVLAACTGTPQAEGDPGLVVTLNDFRIETGKSTVSEGPLVVQVDNHAPATHEFVVVRTDLPAYQLPIGSDGLSVDEEAVDVVDEISEIDIGTSRTLELNLAPGHYVFFCNLEGHYMAGMHEDLEVTAGA